MPQVDWRQNALMLDECGEAWFYPGFLFVQSSTELMGASSFLGYITEVGERGKGKAGVNLRGKICAWRFVTCSPCKHQTLQLFYHEDITLPHPSITARCWPVAGMEEEF